MPDWLGTQIQRHASQHEKVFLWLIHDLMMMLKHSFIHSSGNYDDWRESTTRAEIAVKQSNSMEYSQDQG